MVKFTWECSFSQNLAQLKIKLHFVTKFRLLAHCDVPKVEKGWKHFVTALKPFFPADLNLETSFFTSWWQSYERNLGLNSLKGCYLSLNYNSAIV